VQEIQLLLQQQQQQQQVTSILQDSVDQLTELTTCVFWDTRIAADRSRREKLQPVRMRTPGPLPCLPSTAGVATFLCCEESSLEEVMPMHDKLSLITRGGSNAFSCGSSQWRPQQQLTPGSMAAERNTGCAHAEAHCFTKQPGQPGHVPTA